MSGNAALAAAKRRRNPVEQQSGYLPNKQMSSMMLEEEPLLSKTMSNTGITSDGLRKNRTSQIKDVNELIFEHDKVLFILERRLETLEGDGGNNGSGTTNAELENFTKNTNSEIKLLKTSLVKQQKNIQELSSLVTSLRGTISNQNSTIADLSEQLNNSNLNEQVDVKGQSTVKLDISDTQE
jgi:uncharacterized coiled-coil protein SlyX